MSIVVGYAREREIETDCVQMALGATKYDFEMLELGNYRVELSY